MSFLLPIALLGLLTIPVILLLHLLRSRREPLLISSLRLWRGLEQKRQGVRPRTIPLSLMVLMQLFIAAALTFALAQPAFSFLRNRPQHTIFILDMTTSMTAEDASSTITADISAPASNRRFDAARAIIRSQLQAMGDNDSFAVIGLNPHPEVLFSGDGQQGLEAIQTLDNLEPGATGIDLPAALTLANGLIESKQHNQIIILSDGNYSVAAEELPKVLAPIEWQSIGASSSANQALVNVSAHRLPDNRHRLFARLINYGQDAVNRTVRVTVDQQPFNDVSIQLKPQAETARVWTLPASAQTATVEILEPDVLPLDNRAELLLKGTAGYQALLFSSQTQQLAESQDETPLEPEEENALVRAFEAQPDLTLTVADSPGLSGYDFAEFDLIVFDGLPLDLTEWPAGNLLIINPPLGHPLLTAQNSARNLRPKPETTSPLLSGIDWSGVYFNRLPQVTLPDWAETDLMAVSLDETGGGAAGQAASEYPLIFHGVVGNSRIVVWTFDLTESNLSARLALPLLTNNTLANLLATSLPPVVSLGESVTIDRDLSLELPDGLRLSQTSAVGAESTNQFSRTQQTGIYRIYNQRNNLVGGFAVQAGSALESNLATQFDPTLLVSSDTGADDVPPEVEYEEYWPWLVSLALVVITLEGWLAWRR